MRMCHSKYFNVQYNLLLLQIHLFSNCLPILLTTVIIEGYILYCYCKKILPPSKVLKTLTKFVNTSVLC